MTSTKKPSAAATELTPSLSLTAGGTNFLSAKRMRLLEELSATGSIAAAARAAKLTYKAAWDNISAINNLAEKPVVIRQKGGRGGGGSQLTAFGHKLVTLYRQVAAVQNATAAKLQDERRAPTPGLTTLRVIALRVSARNQYLGRIRKIQKGAVNSEVFLDLGDGLMITSIITRQSVTDLGLKVGGTAVALIKASFVLLADRSPLRVSARNVLAGTVARIQKGSVNGEVHIDLPGHRSMVATLTLDSIRELGLSKGAPCQAIVKASHVLLAVTD